MSRTPLAGQLERTFELYASFLCYAAFRVVAVPSYISAGVLLSRHLLWALEVVLSIKYRFSYWTGSLTE